MVLTDALREQFALHEEFDITVAQTAAAALGLVTQTNLTSFAGCCRPGRARNMQNLAPPESRHRCPC